jgi:hypothetical protein
LSRRFKLIVGPFTESSSTVAVLQHLGFHGIFLIGRAFSSPRALGGVPSLPQLPDAV